MTIYEFMISCLFGAMCGHYLVIWLNGLDSAKKDALFRATVVRPRRPPPEGSPFVTPTSNLPPPADPPPRKPVDPPGGTVICHDDIPPQRAPHPWPALPENPFGNPGDPLPDPMQGQHKCGKCGEWS